MFKKKPIYIVGIIIFTLMLIADVVIFFAVPNTKNPINIPSFENGSFNAEDFEGEMPDFGGEMPDFGGEMPDFEGKAPDFEEKMPEEFNGSMTPPNGNNGNGFLQKIRSMFLVILIISILGDTICIVMLILISRKNNKNGTDINQNDDNDNSPHKSHTNTFLSIIAVILVGAVTISNIPSGDNGSKRETENSILQQEAEIKDIVVTYSGSGTLNSSDAVVINIPASVNVISYTVQNGDYVEEGNEIAKVDKNSVLSTIYKVENLVSEMDTEIAETKELAFDDEIKSQVTGRVKAIYAKESGSVSRTMYENGALILISLGGSMEVQIESDASVEIGQSVTVTLSDEKTIEGKVQQTRNGIITITTSDNGPKHGDTVTVATEDGTNLGSGTLEVSSPLKITNFAGTVKTVHVKVNDEVSVGDVLLTLDDTEDHARYSRLLQERDELMELEDELNQIYKNGTINAKQSGIVSQLDEEIAYTELSDKSTEENVADNLSASSNSFEIVQLSNMTDSDAKITSLVDEPTSPDNETEPPAPETISETYAGIVTKVSYGSIQIKISETDAGNMNIAELETMDKSLFTVEKVYYPDLNVPVYVYQNSENVSSSVDAIKVGYRVLIQIENGTVKQIDYICIEEKLPNQETTPSETSPSDTIPPNYTPGENNNNDSGNMEMPSFNDNDNYQNPTIGNNSEYMQMPSANGDSLPSANGDFGYQQQTTEEEEEATYVVEKVSLYAVTPSETMTIPVSVDELDILSLSVSQEVIVTLDALPGQSITGTIKRISSIGTSENSGRTKYTVTIEVPRTEEMLDGMNASVKIEINRLKDVLTVPASAICEDGTRTYVYTGKVDETGELTNPIDVETGASDGTNVEIIFGISVGDTIYYSYADSIVYRTK